MKFCDFHGPCVSFRENYPPKIKSSHQLEDDINKKNMVPNAMGVSSTFATCLRKLMEVFTRAKTLKLHHCKDSGNSLLKLAVFMHV